VLDARGFAHTGVPAEYSPAIAYAIVTADTTTSGTTFVNLLSLTIAVDGPLDCLNIVFSASLDVQSSGNSPMFQVTVDGVDIGQTQATEGNANGFDAESRVYSITGLSFGLHTVALNWKSINANAVRILPVTDTSSYHGILVCRRTRGVTYDAGGLIGLGRWPVALSCGTTVASRTSNATSTATTLTDVLLSGIMVTTHAPRSALAIRFGAGAVNNSSVTAQYEVLVDGVVVCGTADFGDGAGFQSNAGLVCVVAVSAGVHTLAVNWAGGSGLGSSITISNPYHFATLTAEEVYCTDPDVGDLPVSDMAGFPVASYDPKNLPRVYFSKLSTNLGVIPLGSVVGQCVVCVTEESTMFAIEGTLSTSSGGSATNRSWLTIDGVNVAGSRSGLLSTAGTASMFCTHVVSLARGQHTIQLIANGNGTLNPLTNAYEHASLMVRKASN
jgi:hypothetical protein